MKEYTTKDEHDDADRAFFKADTVLATGVGDLEKAAAIVTEYALTSGDRGAMNFFMARFADFVDAGKLPPLPMRKGFRGVFEALTLPQNKGSKGRPKMSMLEREWARTHANIVSYNVNKGDSLEVALEKTSALRKDSESKIKRDYFKFRKFKK